MKKKSRSKPPRGGGIVYRSRTDKEFFLIHGYTGGPTDFNGLALYLHKRFDATVKVLRLPGHGTVIEDLDSVTYRDFVYFLERELENDIREGRQIVLGGVSFGAQLALTLAARYPVVGVFHVCIPYKVRFPFSVHALSFLKIFKKYWKKHYHPYEIDSRFQAEYYDQMHIHGLKLLHQANRDVRKSLSKITVPCLMIHSMKDSIGHFRSLDAVRKRIRSKEVESTVFDYEIKNHNIFFSPILKKVHKKIGDFFEDADIFEKAKKPDSVSAIVPVYNEGERLGGVLDALVKAGIFKEIVVVDDASDDNTKEVVKSFSVKYLRNKKNMGKSFSMQRGVDETTGNILFFSDGDLEELTPEIVKNIVAPVAEGKVDMFLGVRNNVAQKSFVPFAKLTGERALRRSLWDALPDFYKHRFRIEVGLNYFSKFLGKGYDYKKFDYYQTMKEKKYGFWRGTWLRWWMNLDVVYAYLRAQFVDYFLYKV